MRLQRILTRVLVALLLVLALVPAARAGGRGCPAVPGRGGSHGERIRAGRGRPTGLAARTLRTRRGRHAGRSRRRHLRATSRSARSSAVRRWSCEADGRHRCQALEVRRDRSTRRVPRSPSRTGPSRSRVRTTRAYLIVADVTSASGVASQHAWLVEVPDRAAAGGRALRHPGAGDRADRPVPGRRRGGRATAATSTSAWTSGHPPPARDAARAAAGVGELLTVAPADGSAIAAWDGRPVVPRRPRPGPSAPRPSSTEPPARGQPGRPGAASGRVAGCWTWRSSSTANAAGCGPSTPWWSSRRAAGPPAAARSRPRLRAAGLLGRGGRREERGLCASPAA